MSGHISQPNLYKMCYYTLSSKYEVILMFGIVQALLPVKTLTIFTIGAPNFFLILTGSMRVVEQNGRIDFPDFQARGG